MPDAQTLDFMDINFSITMAFYPLPFGYILRPGKHEFLR